ncbi:hypothetical protein [Desulforapulum autotrophicum]|uniref:hypothetical protein n=1 Tax=Desulforapulum autotrophicum TaxID=2296 RepID=UPI001E62E9D5|nr:hypothetical protein [Desulforapulum autotrophicum]
MAALFNGFQDTIKKISANDRGDFKEIFHLFIQPVNTGFYDPPQGIRDEYFARQGSYGVLSGCLIFDDEIIGIKGPYKFFQIQWVAFTLAMDQSPQFRRHGIKIHVFTGQIKDILF